MYQGCRGDQRIALGARVGHMQTRAALCDSRIDGKNSTVELGQNERIEPCAQHCALSRIFAFDLQNTDFQFKDGDGRYVQAARIHAVGPLLDVRVGFRQAYLAQLGNDVGIEDEH